MANGKERCELIKNYLFDCSPDKVMLIKSWCDIWNDGYRGELSHVFYGYIDALWYFGQVYAGLGVPKMIDDSNGNPFYDGRFKIVESKR